LQGSKILNGLPPVGFSLVTLSACKIAGFWAACRLFSRFIVYSTILSQFLHLNLVGGQTLNRDPAYSLVPYASLAMHWTQQNNTAHSPVSSCKRHESLKEFKTDKERQKCNPDPDAILNNRTTRRLLEVIELSLPQMCCCVYSPQKGVDQLKANFKAFNVLCQKKEWLRLCLIVPIQKMPV